MEKLITNKYNLRDEDITEVVIRVKALLINSNNKILIAYSNGEYFFIGGHVEKEESLIDALNREISEETGMKLNLKDLNPFFCSIAYHKDWPSIGKNRKTEVYFYEVKTDEKPDLSKVQYTEREKEGHFEIQSVRINELEDLLVKRIEQGNDKKGISNEMMAAINAYKNSNL